LRHRRLRRSRARRKQLDYEEAVERGDIHPTGQQQLEESSQWQQPLLPLQSQQHLEQSNPQPQFGRTLLWYAAFGFGVTLMFAVLGRLIGLEEMEDESEYEER
jgi:hypothetical protein